MQGLGLCSFLSGAGQFINNENIFTAQLINDRPNQKKSNLVNSQSAFRVRSYFAHPEKDHTNNDPGDVLDDIGALSLPRNRLHEILKQFKNFSN